MTAQHTPFGRMGEIGAALGVPINNQPVARFQRASRSLERSILSPGQATGQEHLAEQFLKITPAKSQADPCLAPA